MTTSIARAVDVAPVHPINTPCFLGVDFGAARDTWVIACVRRDGGIEVLDAGFNEHPHRPYTIPDVLLKLEKYP